MAKRDGIFCSVEKCKYYEYGRFCLNEAEELEIDEDGRCTQAPILIEDTINPSEFVNE